MAVIENVGDYWISSEMLERCPPGWVIGAVTLGVAMLAAAVVCFSLTGIYPNIWVVGDILVILAACVLIICMCAPRGCGVQIALEVPDRTKECREETVYSFSGDAKIDTEIVERVVNGYREIANRRMTAKKERATLERVQRQHCCTQYRTVIDQVKRV